MTSPADQPAKPPRTWRPMALWTAGILLALGLIWLGSEVYALHRLEKVLAAELAFRPGSLWFPDLKGAAQQLGGPERTIRLLRRYLAMNRPYRREAVLLLGACGRPAVPDLVCQLHSEDILCRHAAMGALREMKREASDALPEIVEISRNATNPVERRMAIITLRPVGGHSPEVIAAATAALADSDEETVAWAVVELRAIGPAAASAVPELIRVLAHGSPGTRQYAAMALEAIGLQAAAAVPALEAALANGDEAVRLHAVEALKKIRGEEAAP